MIYTRGAILFRSLNRSFTLRQEIARLVPTRTCAVATRAAHLNQSSPRLSYSTSTPPDTPSTQDAVTPPSAKTPQTPPPPPVSSPTSSAASAALEKPDFLNEAETTIWNRLSAEFAPTELYVRDISGGCGSMYGIEISSEKFRGANMLKQQRMVNGVLGDLLKGWHGVQLKTKIP